eukprot:3757190-Rhodomonas_salina.1
MDRPLMTTDQTQATHFINNLTVDHINTFNVRQLVELRQNLVCAIEKLKLPQIVDRQLNARAELLISAMQERLQMLALPARVQMNRLVPLPTRRITNPGNTGLDPLPIGPTASMMVCDACYAAQWSTFL